MLSLYLHIPFCKQKCAYCAFYSAPCGEGEKERYCRALEEAIAKAGAEEARPLSTVYFGGGTPALLGKDRLLRLMNAIGTAFSLETDTEITVELNPESTDAALLKALKEMGVNRISLGVQSLQEQELKRLGRLHSAFQAEEALKAIFEAGFTNVSADVMFGLPEQTAASFEETLDRLLSYPITHLSSYSLQWEEGTPLGQNPSPMEEEQEELLWQILCQKAKEAGFGHYEISNFAKAGFESRHNSTYWKRGDYIGLGPSAHSFWNGVRYSFLPDREAFCKAPWPLLNPEPISEAEAKEEALMLGLRLKEGVPLDWLSKKLNLSRYEPFSTVQEGRFCLNERGFYLSNTIIGELLYELQTDEH